MVVTDSGHIFIGDSRVYKSTDMAETWEEANSGIPTTSILSMLYNKANGDIVVGTYEDGIYVSHDMGTTWLEKNTGLTDFAGMRITSLYQHVDGIIYATGTNYSTGYIYRSTDHGELWEVISDGIPDDKAFTDLTLTSDNRVYAITWNGSVYRSDPAQEVFELAETGLRPASYKSIAVLASDVLLVGAIFEGVYRSDSFGDNWVPQSGTGLYGPDCWDIIYDESHDRSYISMRSTGIFSSNGMGDSWEVKNTGLVHTEVDDIIITEDNTIFAGVSRGGVYRSFDGGVNWEWGSPDFEYSSVNAMAYKPGFLFAGLSGSGVYISTDDGDSWIESGLDLTVGWISALAIGSEGKVYAGLTTGIIHRSDDDGVSWTDVYDADDEIMDLVHNHHTNTMLAAVDDNSTGGVHRSIEGGIWSRQISGLGSNRVLSLAVSPVENKIYASTADNGIFISNDNGDTWYKPTSNGLPPWISAVGVNSRGEIFAGSNKIYSSRDGGENYSIFSEEPSGVSDAAFAFDTTEVLYIGTPDRSVWKSINPTIVRNVHFTVKMINEDGFNSSSQSVAVGGFFNGWVANDLILTSQNDAEMTYSGSLLLTETSDVIAGGFFDYKYVVPPTGWERIEYNRRAEWDGNNDLFLDTVWFSNQKEFTRMNTSAIALDGTGSRGVAWADYDNDGDEDVIITEAGSGSKNDLFRNDGGVFTQITTGPVATDDGDSRTACWGDYDNDGYVDLYITNLGGQNNFLYKNNGDGSFTSVTNSETVIHGGSSVSAVWADFDNDGFIDLFVTNSGVELNSLFMNNGDGTFRSITGQTIVTDAADSRGCAAVDYDNDGDIDIFVANAADGENDVLYQNDGGANFTGVYSGPVHDEKTVSSGGSWGDYNNDGWLDLYVSTREGEPNKLYKNNQGAFIRVSSTVMPADSSVSYGSSWVDYDNDGLLDLFVGNIAGQRSFLYKQREGGNFSHVVLGPIVESPNTNTRGAAWGDFNNDGFPDLVIGNNGESNPLYRNNISVNHFLKVKLVGTRSNSFALGTVVLAYHADTDGNAVVQRRDILGQTGFLSQNSTIATFGLGQKSTIDSLVVFWPGGGKEIVSNISAIDQVLTLTESNPLSPPPTPILNTPANGSIGIVVDPSLTWNPAGDATQYHLIFANNNTFNPLIIEDTVVTQTSYAINGLQYDQSYYWQVRAKNEAGWGPWSEVWSFITGPFSGTLSEPTLISPPNEQQGVPIPAPLRWTSQTSGIYNVQIATDDQFSNLVYNNATITDTLIFVDHSYLDFSTEYFWRVNVTVSGEISPWSISRLFLTQSNEIQVFKTLNFPQHDRRDEFSSSDYLMVGIPGASNALFRDIFTGDAGEEWMAYWDNGKTGNPSEYFVAYDGSNTFRFAPGQAFWIIHNGTVNIDKKIAAAPLNTLAQAEVVIQSGWNMITSPFEHRISWETVKRANNITADIKLWWYDRSNQTFTVSTHLEPMEGFYFNNPLATRTILLVPYIDSFGKPIVHHEVIWDLDIELTSGETRGASVRIGVAADAEISLDDFDYRKPHALADLADIYFERPDWARDNSMFGSDIRPEISDVEVWDFQVYTPQKNEARLTFVGLSSIPEDYDVFLIDKTRMSYQNLKDDNNYEFISTPALSNFEIIVGDAEAVEEQLESIIPMTYTLGQNYPNPFNPTTTIPLTLPEQSEIILKVFNILGQEVVTLFNGTLNAGRHYILWDGTNQARALMPSGIYIYRMITTKGFKFTGKMIFIK